MAQGVATLCDGDPLETIEFESPSAEATVAQFNIPWSEPLEQHRQTPAIG